MVAIPVVSALIGVWQTYLTTLLGNRVMADLRSRLFAHLQRMDLAFFTATRTGAIQSRLANDVGGVQSVLSETASSILSNTVTVVGRAGGDAAAVVAAHARRGGAAAAVRAAAGAGRAGAARGSRGARRSRCRT